MERLRGKVRVCCGGKGVKHTHIQTHTSSQQKKVVMDTEITQALFDEDIHTHTLTHSLFSLSRTHVHFAF